MALIRNKPYQSMFILERTTAFSSPASFSCSAGFHLLPDSSGCGKLTLLPVSANHRSTLDNEWQRSDLVQHCQFSYIYQGFFYIVMYMPWMTFLAGFVMLFCIGTSSVFSNFKHALCLSVACPAGSFSSGARCTACPQGTYQSESGKDLCFTCTSGTSTAAVGAFSPSQCKWKLGPFFLTRINWVQHMSWIL